MGSPLYDITICYNGQVIKDAPEDWEFRTTTNFVCDFYHQMLFGYKPPKTGRICIHLDKEEKWDSPNYFGSICSVGRTIDEQKYLTLSKQGQLEYILQIVHHACLDLCDNFGWDKVAFEGAHKQIVDRNFIFSLTYPSKKSKDRHTSASVIIEKTLKTSSLSIELKNDNEIEKIVFFTKRNWFWSDSVYDLAKNSKWLDESAFGVSSKKTNKFGYYSIVDKVIIGNLTFKENEF